MSDGVSGDSSVTNSVDGVEAYAKPLFVDHRKLQIKRFQVNEEVFSKILESVDGGAWRSGINEAEIAKIDEELNSTGSAIISSGDSGRGLILRKRKLQRQGLMPDGT